jgi:predicted transposase/invertase (TIGR01784 family)
MTKEETRRIVDENYIAFKYDDTAKLILANPDDTYVMKKLLEEILDINLFDVTIKPNEFPRDNKNIKSNYLDILVSTDNLTADVEININPSGSKYMRNFVYLSRVISNYYHTNEDYDTNKYFCLINLDFTSKVKSKDELIKSSFDISKAIKVFYIQEDNKTKYLDNFKIIKINMEEMRKLYYTKDEKLKEKFKILLAGSITRKELNEFSLTMKDEGVDMIKETVNKVDINELADDVFGYFGDDSEKLRRSEQHEFYRYGKEEATITIAKNMLAKDMDVNFISEVTNLSIDEINALKNN